MKSGWYSFQPQFTVEVYAVAERKLALGSKREVLHELEAEGDSLVEGDQQPTTLNTRKIRLPLALHD